MKYKNTKTGAIINSSCVINGGNWELYEKTGQKEETKQVEKAEGPVKEVEEVEEPERNETGVTKKQIMQELDSMGVKYNPNAKKDELYNLMLGK